MFKVLLLPCIGIVLLLQFRLQKESKNYRINERKESFYIDTTGTPNIHTFFKYTSVYLK